MIACGRYEFEIVIPDRDDESLNIVSLSVFIVATLVALITILLLSLIANFNSNGIFFQFFYGTRNQSV